MGRSGKFRGKPRPQAAVRTVQSSPQGSAGAHSNPGSSSSSSSSPIKGGGGAAKIAIADGQVVGGSSMMSMSGQAAPSPSKDKGKGKMPLTPSNSTSTVATSSSSSSSSSTSLSLPRFLSPAMITEYHSNMASLLRMSRKVLHISSTQNISIAAALGPDDDWFQAAKGLTEDVLRKFGGLAAGVGGGGGDERVADMLREMMDMAVRAREVLRGIEEGLDAERGTGGGAVGEGRT